MTHDIEGGRNINTAEDEWDSWLAFGTHDTLYGLVDALLTSTRDIDSSLESIYHAQHINDATGDDLDKFGQLVNTPRQSGESDAKYRTRLKAAFRVGNIGTTADQFIEFTASILGTSVENVELGYNYGPEPAEVQVLASSSLYDDVNLTDQQVVDILDDAVPAGHEVNAIEQGTFILKSDGQTNDPNEGLTSDSIQTGGTLATDLL